jgi:hypothetical protein
VYRVLEEIDRMTRDNWHDAVADIQQMTQLATARQHQLAAIAGITLPQDMPQLVAAAGLRTALGADIGSSDEFDVSDFQEYTLAALETPTLRITTPPENSADASAWITFLRLKRRQQALQNLELMAGDIVEADGTDLASEVSSIGSNGRVYFKGSGSRRAWPDQLIILCRKDDNTKKARNLKQKAANAVALHARTDAWTLAKRQELLHSEVHGPLTLAIVQELRDVIESAQDERPIQLFIEEHPQTIAALLGGRERFILPRYPLAGKYVPDFLAGDIDSLGIRWMLVELETPKCSVTLASKNELDMFARRGVAQIQDWREWLQNNLDMARRPVSKDGAGLIDIRPMSEGLVLVGRRELLKDNSHAVRNPFRERNAIRIQTYDWLVERLLGIVEYVGPPRTSPDVLKPFRAASRKSAP